MREALVLEIKKNRNLLPRDCDFYSVLIYRYIQIRKSDRL